VQATFTAHGSKGTVAQQCAAVTWQYSL